MNAKQKIKIISGLFILIGIVAGAARVDRTTVAETAPPRMDGTALALLEQHIPFAIAPLPAETRSDDLFNLDIIVHLDEQGRELEYNWRAMDNETILVECADFYDLYYRCDMPSELNVRVITKDHTGSIVSTRRGMVAIN